MVEPKTINDIRLAVLIDADNVSYHYLDSMMPEVARYGLPTIKRIYGDWTSPNLGGWKPLLQEYAIIPIQQFSYTTGKNSTDSTLIIDAMDLLYSGNVDAFCLVSSDSDFTRLATRLREAGRKVYGFGEMKTPRPFIAACDRFVYLEVLKEDDDADEHGEEEDRNRGNRTSGQDQGSRNGRNKKLDESTANSESGRRDHRGGRKYAGEGDSDHSGAGETENGRRQEGPGQAEDRRRAAKMDRPMKRLIFRCIEDVADDEGWSNLANVGNLLMNIKPDFDPRNYGCRKLSQLMDNLPEIETTYRNGGGQMTVKHVFVRLKDA